MKRADLVKAVAQELGMTQKDVLAVEETIEKVIKETLAKGEEISLASFIKLEVKETKARDCANPKDRTQIIHVEAGKKVAMKALKDLKECVK